MDKNITTILIKKEGDKIEFEYKNCGLKEAYNLTMTHLMDYLLALDSKSRNILIDWTIKQVNTIRGH